MNFHLKFENKLGILAKKDPSFDCPVAPMGQKRMIPKPCLENRELQDKVSPLTLKHYYRLFILYTVGIVLSCLILVKEIAILASAKFQMATRAF